MDNEKYGIELELITNKFKQKMQEVKNAFKGVKDQKVNVNANTEFLKRDLEIASNQVEYLRDKLARLRTQQKGLFDWQKDTDKGKQLANEIEVVSLQLEKAGLKADKLADRLNRASNEGNKIKETVSKANFSKGLDKMTSKIKRFGLALLSVRSIFSLVSRASSAYLAQDTELANKLQSAWVGLGAILAPIINFITTLILKLVSVINGVIKALTGVDLIAKASAKSMKSAAGSAKSLTKALAGFDELQNLDSDTSGGGGIGGILDPFATIDEDWATMMEKIYKATDTFKTNLVKKMRDSMELAKKVLKLSGFSDFFIDMYDFAANGSIKVLEGFVDSFKGILMIIDGVLSADKDKIIEGFKTLIKGIWDMITGLVQVIVGAIGMLITAVIDLVVAGAKWIYNNVLVPIDNWVDDKIRKPIKEKVGDAINWAKQQFEGWKNNIKLFISSAKEQFEGWKNNIKLFINTIGSWFSNLWTALLRGFATMWNKIANMANKVGGKFGMSTLPTINSYAVGTNYVPEDQLAFIHKGEAVVPKKYNNGSYQPVNNDETNYLLQQVITAINNIEINPYITVKDVGKASLSYINNKSRQLGESVVV